MPKPTYIRLDGTAQICANCKHFQQHYIKGSFYYGGFAPVDCGHCCRSRTKPRRPGDSCEEFEGKEVTGYEGKLSDRGAVQ